MDSLFKETVCKAFGAALTDETLKEKRVHYLTPAGIVSGRVIFPHLETEPQDEKQHLEETTTKSIVNGARKSFIEMSGTPSPLAHDGFLVLRDVTIRPLFPSREAEQRLKTFVLFTDQVIGVFLADEEWCS